MPFAKANVTLKNKRASIQVSAPGWIVSTGICLMRFMGNVRDVPVLHGLVDG